MSTDTKDTKPKTLRLQKPSKPFNIAKSLWETLKHFYSDPVTIQYPTEKKILPSFVRHKLNNKIEDCIGCNQCARICPVDCIEIDSIKKVREEVNESSSGHKRNFWLLRFDIDMGKCCFCSLCTQVCPTGCLTMTDNYEFAQRTRNAIIFHFGEFKASEIEAKREEFQKALDAEKEAKKKEKAAAKKAEKADDKAEKKAGKKDDEKKTDDKK